MLRVLIKRLIICGEIYNMFNRVWMQETSVTLNVDNNTLLKMKDSVEHILSPENNHELVEVKNKDKKRMVI
nr:hypothetical protein CJLB15_00068 [Campylobacter phage CJLB-15]